MIGLLPDLEALAPIQRARVIEADAKHQLSQSLWRAALGQSEAQPRGTVSSSAGLTSLLGSEATKALLFAREYSNDPAAPVATEIRARPLGEAGSAAAPVSGLGANQRYAPILTAAANRTGIPAAALASIIDAEAGRNADGSWNAAARNPRSSARGLGQFLSATWEGMAERPGSWLNAYARKAGWLDSRGRAQASSRAALMDLRFDPAASIHTIADFARQNLDLLKRQGVAVGDGTSEIARAAYLTHHLGAGDAGKFLGEGLSQTRARHLLSAQVGHRRAAEEIAAIGDARGAHRNWLNAYVARNINPLRYLPGQG